MKLGHIFRRNKQLFFKFLFILKTKFNLSPRIASMYRKIDKVHTLSSRALKKVCSALQFRKLIKDEWLSKPYVDVLVNFANEAPVLKICLNNHTTNAIVDTGSTYSLVPHCIWQSLKMNKNRLDTSVQCQFVILKVLSNL